MAAVTINIGHPYHGWASGDVQSVQRLCEYGLASSNEGLVLRLGALTCDVIVQDVVFLHGIIEKPFRFFVHHEDFPLCRDISAGKLQTSRRTKTYIVSCCMANGA